MRRVSEWIFPRLDAWICAAARKGNDLSKGPGRIERTIEELFSAEPDSAFTTDQIGERVYGSEKSGHGRKSRAVSIIRAALRD